MSIGDTNDQIEREKMLKNMEEVGKFKFARVSRVHKIEWVMLIECNRASTVLYCVMLFIYLGFDIAFNTV